MYQFFNFLSGGAGQTTSPWTVVSASDGSSITSTGTNITNASDLIWSTTAASAAHSWFLMQNTIMRSGSIVSSSTDPDASIYLLVDCEYNASNSEAYARIAWDWNEYDCSAATTASAPSPHSDNTEYHYRSNQGDQRFMYDYHASYPTYFHGTMDSTGSFYAYSANAQYVGAYANYPFMACIVRLETPRTIAVDSFPVVAKFQYDVSVKGPMDKSSIYNDYWKDGDPSPTQYAEFGWSMWWSDGSRLTYAGRPGWTVSYANYMILGDTMDYQGSDIDGTYPMLPVFCMTTHTNKLAVRGRVPDFFQAPGYTNINGATVPFSGTPTHCVVGDYFLPVTASLLPGV